MKNELLNQLKTGIEDIEKDFEELREFGKNKFNDFIGKHIDLLAIAVKKTIEEANRIYREANENPEETLTRKESREINEAISSLQKGRETLDKISTAIGNR